jgi:putative intracellular protease/amidase
MSSSLPLAGKKVAVLVESQYIPGEVQIYQERFAGYGATVDLVSRLWGQSKQKFYSTVEPEGENVPPIEWLEVSLDVDNVHPDDYAAVIMTANYTSVRLRSSEAPTNSSSAADVARRAPAVHFFRRAMQNPRIVKGAPCHALWLLTPSPDILASRKVICNTVVLADVVNAGAVYTPCPAGTPEEKQVIVDRDLVTNSTWKASKALVDTIKDLIVTLST